ncbi:MAG: choice-of-anchor B family protein [Ardenticatenales bacterium]|nr:choice-of-anchor B family protein [Ardenticatenales bacterium]
MSRTVLIIPVILLFLGIIVLAPTTGAAPVAPLRFRTPTATVPAPQAIQGAAELACRIKSESAIPNQMLAPVSNATCTAGSAAGYPCQNIDLLSLLPSAQLNPSWVTGSSRNGNDIWGWYHPETGAEYAVVGLRRGVAFVNVTTPTVPIVEAFHPSALNDPSRELWRDVRVYKNHAFIVSEIDPHGMQVVDMTQLPNITQVAHYMGVGGAHSITINEASGFAYIMGARNPLNPSQRSCAGGLHVVDIRDPKNPTFAGCFANDGYTHDAQCVVYPTGTPYAGREICFAYNEDTLTIVDVSDKSNMTMLSRVSYENAKYTHQGWLTEDYRYMLMDDELDEFPSTGGLNTRTFMWDVSDLSNPRHIDTLVRDSQTIDHDQYIRGDFSFQSNYRAGVSILNVASISDTHEVGYFDIYPQDDAPSFNGAWGSYVYLPSGNILTNGIEQGLFVLRPTNSAVAPDFDVETSMTHAPICQGQSASIPVHTRALYGYQGNLSLTLKGAPAGLTALFSDTTVQAGAQVSLTLEASDTMTGTTYLTLEGRDGTTTRQQLFGVQVRTVPLSGPTLVSPAPDAAQSDTVTFTWEPATGATGYRLQVASDADFTTLLLDESITETTATRALSGSTEYHWRVIAENECGPGSASEVRTFTSEGISLWLPVLVR